MQLPLFTLPPPASRTSADPFVTSRTFSSTDDVTARTTTASPLMRWALTNDRPLAVGGRQGEGRLRSAGKKAEIVIDRLGRIPDRYEKPHNVVPLL